MKLLAILFLVVIGLSYLAINVQMNGTEDFDIGNNAEEVCESTALSYVDDGFQAVLRTYESREALFGVNIVSIQDTSEPFFRIAGVVPELTGEYRGLVREHSEVEIGGSTFGFDSFIQENGKPYLEFCINGVAPTKEERWKKDQRRADSFERRRLEYPGVQPLHALDSSQVNSLCDAEAEFLLKQEEMFEVPDSGKRNKEILMSDCRDRLRKNFEQYPELLRVQVGIN
tara:strand:+ start:282 stop:965 length:684 start_codon:yes stop_codon:yes gene_type:complete